MVKLIIGIVKFHNHNVRGSGGNWNFRVTFAYLIYW